MSKGTDSGLLALIGWLSVTAGIMTWIISLILQENGEELVLGIFLGIILGVPGVAILSAQWLGNNKQNHALLSDKAKGSVSAYYAPPISKPKLSETARIGSAAWDYAPPISRPKLSRTPPRKVDKRPISAPRKVDKRPINRPTPKSSSRSGNTPTGNSRSSPIPAPPARDIQADKKKWEKMGREFEEYIIKGFDRNEYKLLEWRSDKFIAEWGGPTSSRAPDLLMEHIPSRERFAIECKYRSRAGYSGVLWARPDQIQNYRDYAATMKVPVYVAIGLGGTPKEPDAIYIIRLEKLRFQVASLEYLEKFRFPPHVTSMEFG